MGRDIKSKHAFEHFVYVQSKKYSNQININNGSSFSLSLNDKSLHVMKIYNLNVRRSNILKLYIKNGGKGGNNTRYNLMVISKSKIFVDRSNHQFPIMGQMELDT